METIKFNIWDIERNQYFRDVLSLKKDKIVKWASLEKRTSNNVEWLQFTGLHDKNGREIYKGDLLLDIEFDEEGNDISGIYPVVYCAEIGAWCVDNSYAKNGSSLVNMTDYFGKENLEVIGNIYETPDLIK